MANYAVTVYTGTIRACVGSACEDLEFKLDAIDTAKTVRLIGIADIGPGKYYQAYLIIDA